MFSLPEQKASFSGDINTSLTLNSKQNLSWEPSLRVHGAAQRAASSPTATENAGTFFRVPLQKSWPGAKLRTAQLRTVFL